MKLGFIGLGAMGKPMATNLLRSGQPLWVWNRNPGPVEELVQKGAERASAPAEAANVDVLFSMLADDAALRAVMIDAGALDAMPPGSIHVNMATISVACARNMAELHARRAVSYVAAPVLGRPDLGAAAKLNIIAAGADQVIDRLQPFLDLLGQKTWRFGDAPERANAVKLGANLTIAMAVEAMGEGSGLAKAYGVEPVSFIDLLSSTLYAGSPVYKGYGQLISQERYSPPGFTLRLALKDIRLVFEAAQEADLALPAGSAIKDNLDAAVKQGDGELDLAALAKMAARRLK